MLGYFPFSIKETPLFLRFQADAFEIICFNDYQNEIILNKNDSFVV